MGGASNRHGHGDLTVAQWAGQAYDLRANGRSGRPTRLACEPLGVINPQGRPVLECTCLLQKPPRGEAEQTAHPGWVTMRRAARVEPPSHELGDLSCT